MKAITVLTPTEQSPFDRALANLAEAFDFTVVDRCPEPTCESCLPVELSAAA